MNPCSPDHQFALLLQAQFDHEVGQKKSQAPKGNEKCLVDPAWELVDPTPNIHMLFVAFGQQFFWNKLESVTVAWSKRMTSCAGICSYQGRAGLCKITLSEPLLKLRPRKDLVETLLHEMIHAYLFVTHNNRDRDGHGPEFHKHMHRINTMAGTKISVYHDFHDEVRLYKQHWWRCTGPCQNRKPFFGMVKRAMNRVPGPNDLWWAEHKRTCDGSFIKVREPKKENNTNKSSKKPSNSPVKNPTNPKNDIRSYITAVPKTTAFYDLTNSPKGPIGDGNNVIDLTSYETVRNHWANKYSNQNDRKRISPTPSYVSPKRTKVDGSNSLVNCPGCSKLLPHNEIDDHIDDCIFRSVSPSFTKCSICDKEVSVDLYNEHLLHCRQEKVKCELCLQLIVQSVIHEHTELCVANVFGEPMEEEISCLVCNKKIVKSNLNDHLDVCTSMKEVFSEPELNGDNSSNDKVEEKKYNCPFCLILIFEKEMNRHLDVCLTTEDDNLNKSVIIDEFNLNRDDNLNGGDNLNDDGNLNDKVEEKKYNCPFCLILILEKEMNRHLDVCLNTKDDNLNKSVVIDEFNSDF